MAEPSNTAGQSLMEKMRARRSQHDLAADEVDKRVQERVEQMERDRKAQEQAKNEEEAKAMREAEEELKRMEEEAKAKAAESKKPGKETLVRRLNEKIREETLRAEQEAEARWLKLGVATGKLKFGFSKSHIKVIAPRKESDKDTVWEINVPKDLISAELGHWSDDDEDDFDESGLPKMSKKDKKKTWKKRFLGVSSHYLKDSWVKDGAAADEASSPSKEPLDFGRRASELSSLWEAKAAGENDAAAEAERRLLEQEARRMEIQRNQEYLSKLQDKERAEAELRLKEESESKRKQELEELRQMQEKLRLESKRYEEEQQRQKEELERERERRRQQPPKAVQEAAKAELEEKQRKEAEMQKAIEEAKAKAEEEAKKNANKVDRAKLRFVMEESLGEYQFQRPNREFLGMRHFLMVPKESWVKSKLKELAEDSVGLSKVALATFTDIMFLSIPGEEAYRVIHQPVQRKGIKVALGPPELQGSFFININNEDYMLLGSDRKEAVFWCKMITACQKYVPTEELDEVVKPKY